MGLVSPFDRSGRPAGIRVRRPGDRRSLSRSATRALDVMELFGELERPLRAVEIARHLGLRPSTTDQLLQTLVASAHLQFDARARSYRPSPRLLGFGRWLVGTFGADDRLAQVVRRVSAETGLVATLTTPNDLFMQVIDSARPEGLHVERGQRVSMFGSATGSAYLATLPIGEVERLAYRARVAPVEIARVLGQLDAIRRDGFADGANQVAVREDADAMWSIAVPIPQRGLPFAIVLGISGPAPHVRERRDQLQRMLRTAAEGCAR